MYLTIYFAIYYGIDYRSISRYMQRQHAYPGYQKYRITMQQHARYPRAHLLIQKMNQDQPPTPFFVPYSKV